VGTHTNRKGNFEVVRSPMHNAREAHFDR